MLDGVFQGAILENTTVALDMLAICGGCEVLPEEGVVDVTTTVETKGRLKSDALFRGSGPGVIVLGSVEGINISFVVLVVMQSHDLCDDVWLERIVAIREVGEGVCARHDDGCGEKYSEWTLGVVVHSMTCLGGFNSPFHRISYIQPIRGPARRIAQCISHTLSLHIRRWSPICRGWSLFDWFSTLLSHFYIVLDGYHRQDNARQPGLVW